MNHLIYLFVINDLIMIMDIYRIIMLCLYKEEIDMMGLLGLLLVRILRGFYYMGSR